MKKNCPPISRILSPKKKKNKNGGLSFIYAQHRCCAVSAYPPHDASNIVCSRSDKLRCTWHFNSQGLSASDIATERRALLPHIFTLTSTMQGGNFL